MEYAVAGGAEVIEGYPLATTVGKSAASLYTGTVELFTRAGFAMHAEPDGRRVVMRHAADRCPHDRAPNRVERRE